MPKSTIFRQTVVFPTTNYLLMGHSVQQFHESGLLFSFPKDWQVLKYDAHPYFRAISGAGMRGADFIWVDSAGVLTLMEVKHFRKPSQPGIDAPDLLPPPAELAEAVGRKMADTLMGIQVVEGYLSRKWTFRVWRRLAQLIGKRAPQMGEWMVWQNLHRAGEVHRPKRIVLWLEIPGCEITQRYTASVREVFAPFLRDQLPDFSLECEISSSHEIPESLSGIQAIHRDEQ